MRDNYYHILGLDNYASIEEIKVAYRTLAKKYHPDKNPDKPEVEEKFKRVSRAYKFLSDPDKKSIYDTRLNYNSKSSTTGPSYRPHYARRETFYSTERRKYTPTAWMLGKIFIILLIMTVILVPLTLFYQSSVRFYEVAEDSYAKGNISDALLNYNRAISQFGGRSVQAAIKASEIYYYELDNYKQALFFANKGMDYAEKTTDQAYLHYLKGIAYSGLNEPDNALTQLQKADSLSYPKDSIIFQTAMLHAFWFSNFNEGRKKFKDLIDRSVKTTSSWFGMAWCLQQMGQPREAVKGYSEVIKADSNRVLAYYYRGINEVQLNDSLNACNDFMKAYDLGYRNAIIQFRRYCVSDSVKQLLK